MSAMLARRLELSDAEVMLLRRAAPLHDVGKIGIPDGILLKPGSLTRDEFTEMRKHTSIGAGILSGSRFPVLQVAEEIALYHHENWDGSGYMSLERDLIPFTAQIVRAADVFDALVHKRPYKHPWPLDEAIEEIRTLSGVFFNPEITRALLALVEENPLELSGAPPALEEIFDGEGVSVAIPPLSRTDEGVGSVASA
jgi:putative two-component system response regulator